MPDDSQIDKFAKSFQKEMEEEKEKEEKFEKTLQKITSIVTNKKFIYGGLAVVLVVFYIVLVVINKDPIRSALVFIVVVPLITLKIAFEAFILFILLPLFISNKEVNTYKKAFTVTAVLFFASIYLFIVPFPFIRLIFQIIIAYVILTRTYVDLNAIKLLVLSALMSIISNAIVGVASLLF